MFYQTTGSASTVMAMAHESKQSVAQFQTLIWHVPPPATLDRKVLLPPALAVLRDAALASWPDPSTPPTRTEPLAKYIAALNVAVQARPDMKTLLESELAQTLQALAHVFDALSGRAGTMNKKLGLALAGARAARLATGYYKVAPWSLDLPLVVDLQCEALHILSLQGHGGSTARALAQLYEHGLGQTSDAVCEAYLRVGEVFWRANMLLQTAPPALTSDDKASWYPLTLC